MQQIDFADIMTALEANSRTFFIPITRLPEGLKESITSAYLCMRAIDDIEDHPALDNETKAALLREISVVFQRQTYETGFDISDQFQAQFRPYRRVLPPVSAGLGRWASYAPTEIAPAIWDATAAMADRMAYWASVNWKVQTQSDLDAYTYSVAGTVGLLVATILTWYDGTQLDRGEAINFGRALQVTNIARNRAEDLARDVDFYPQGWNDRDVRDYARHWISRTEDYVKTIPPAPFQYFIQLPMALAKATLDALDSGQQKLSREAVMEIAGQMSY